MLRIILGIVAGIVVGWFVSFVLLTILWMVLGSDGSFRPGTFEISMSWIGAMMVVSVISGAAGGLLAGKIGRWAKMPIVFTVLVALLGVPGVAKAFMDAGGPPTPREGDVTMFEAMPHSTQPIWSALAGMAVFAASAFAGASLVGPKKD